jgi:hypothetical protein
MALSAFKTGIRLPYFGILSECTSGEYVIRDR